MDWTVATLLRAVPLILSAASISAAILLDPSLRAASRCSDTPAWIAPMAPGTMPTT